MKQYLAVCGIAIIALAMVGSMAIVQTIEDQNAMGKPSKQSIAEPAVIAASE